MENIYDYIIVGGGPTGLTLAWLLEDKNRKILLIDKEKTLGGCHRVQRVDGFFSEHGPRVYSTAFLTFIEILKDMEIDFFEHFIEYKVQFTKIGKKTPSSFNNNEKWAFFKAYISLIFDIDFGKKISIKSFMDENNFTKGAKDYVERFCRLTDGASTEDYTLFQFLQISNQHYFYKLYQPRETNDKGLFKLWEEKLLKTKNITILKETNVIKLNKGDGNFVNSISIIKNNIIGEVYGKKIILTMPPKPLYQIMKASVGLENSFGSIEKLKEWKSKNSYFDYICLTFHYLDKVNLPQKMGFPRTPWGIGFIIVSNYMNFSKEPSKECVSITLTFPEVKNEFGKTAHECTKDEISEYIQKQLPFFPKPDKVIFSPNVVRSGDKWINLDTAYVVTTENKFLKDNSNTITNLYTVGIHNGNSNYYFTSIEASVQNAAIFCKKEITDLKYELTIQKTLDITEIIHSTLMLIILIVLIYIIKQKYYKNF
jgi:hypothetical protein